MHYKSIIRPLAMFLISVLSALSLWSCEGIYDTYKDCHIYVRFKYDYNMDWKDKFAEQCDKVELFLFDSRGILIDTFSDGGEGLANPDYQVEIPIHAGDYTIMAWAGRKESYDLSDMLKGISTKYDLILKLKTSVNDISKELEPLWWGAPIDFTYTGNSHQVETIDLLKNTNTINFNIHYDPLKTPLSISDVDVTLKASNGAYTYDNSFEDPNPIIFTPYYKSGNTKASETLIYTLSTLRLVKGQDVKFTVTDIPTGTSLFPYKDMDLIRYLLMTKPEELADQEYLDREDTWDIDLYISGDGYIATKITINGWVVWTQGTEL